jgi:hypothetical protein
VDAKIQKIFKKLDKLEYIRLTINQILRVIGTMILLQLNYILANSYITKQKAKLIDLRIRRRINNFA